MELKQLITVSFLVSFAFCMPTWADPTRDGAIDLTFVPTNWTVSSPTRVLAHFDNQAETDAEKEGTEITLFVDAGDRVMFTIYDASTNRHSIVCGDWTNGVVCNRLIINGMTNRIVASWKNLNTGRSNAELRLYVNGIDWTTTCIWRQNPKHTSWCWTNEVYGYYEASQTRIDFPAAVTNVGSITNNHKCNATNYAANVRWVSATVHTSAYGMIQADFPTNVLPFVETNGMKTTKTFKHPQTIAQAIYPSMLSTNRSNIDTWVKQFAQMFDGTETSSEGSEEDVNKIQTLLSVANTNKFDIAMNCVVRDCHIMNSHSNLWTNSAYVLNIGTDSLVSAVAVSTVTATNAFTYPSVIDMADRSVVSNYISAWAEEMQRYTNYSYVMHGELTLLWPTNSYMKSPTYSRNGLKWFQEYCSNYYHHATNMLFPVSPVDYKPYMDNSPIASQALAIHSSATNLLEITTDPEHWARWWEWRRLVFANLLNEYAVAADRINVGTNDYWKGTIFFMTPNSPWCEVSAVDMKLASRIPNLQWMVMENHRCDSYGNDAPSREEEVLLQLRDLKSITTNGTGFGSYVMAHSYICPNYVTNGSGDVTDTNFTYNMSWMTNDMAYAASREFASQLIVPFSSYLLVDRPGYVQDWQHSSNVPALSQAWNKIRYRDLWEPISNVAPFTVVTDVSFELTWSAPEEAVGYELVFSTNSDFSTTNWFTFVEATNRLIYDTRTNPLPAGVDIYWHVRGRFQELHLANDGTVTSTSTYYGAWYPTNAAILTNPKELSVTPMSREVSAAAGTTTFSVTNTGGGTMVYAASESESWLSITNGGIGTNYGTLTISYEANPNTIARTGMVTISASGALGSPVNVTVVQAVAWDAGYQDIGGGWRRLAWFGDYTPMGGDGWIWHNKHGFLQISASSTPQDVWMFTNNQGWLWTTSSQYPFIYRSSPEAWLWYNGSTNPRWFMNMTTSQWESWP